MASVLVADDDTVFADSLRRALLTRGHSAISLGDSGPVHAVIAAQEFDVIVTSAEMEGAPAFEVLPAAKQKDPDVEVVVVTRHPNLLAAMRSIRAQAFDYVEKPAAGAELIPVILRAIERRSNRLPSTLNAASRALLDAREGQRLPEIAVEVARTVMRADDVSLMLVGPDGSLYVAASIGLSKQVVAEARVASGERIAGRVASMREPVLFADSVIDDPRFADTPTFGRVMSSIVCPLRARERVIGVLNLSRVMRDRPFRDNDKVVASVVAAQIAMALDNGRLVREVAQAERLGSAGQLAASVAHEINNPLAVIVAGQEQLKIALGKVAAEVSELEARVAVEELQVVCTDAMAGAMRIRDIVRDLSTLARTDETPIVFDINHAIRAALRVANTHLAPVATVTTEIGDDVMVRGIPARLAQVFVNLLLNAAEAFRGRVDNRVTVRSRRQQDRVIVEVQDNGRGIVSEHLSRVFETFFTTKSSAGPGAGFGLAICREIVRSHHGGIRIDSTPGKGATFTIELPFAGEGDVPSLGIEPVDEARAPLRVLFVDDEPPIRRSYARAFKKLYSVSLASDGAEALRMIADAPPFDVIVCDLLMPNMTGMELFQQVQQHHPQLVDAFIFVTGGSAIPNVQAFLASLAVPILEKPFVSDQLAVLIEARGRRASARWE